MVKYFEVPFADAGDTTTIPDAVQPGGEVSFTQGYGVKYQTTVDSGGINIERAKMNYLFNEITAALKQYQEHSVPDYIAGHEYSIYDRVRYTDDNVYQSLIDANTDLPTDPSSWVLNIIPEVKNNYTATAAPTATDDDSDGYSVGSAWFDVTNDQAYWCIDASTAAAIWLQLNSATGVSSFSLISGLVPSSIAGTSTTATISISSGTVNDSTKTFTISAPSGFSWAVSNGNAANGYQGGYPP